MYDLNQILYNCTLQVTNRLKEFDLIDRVSEELWTEVRNIVQEAVIKTIPNIKEMQKRQNGCLRRPCKQARKEEKQKAKEKWKDISIEFRVPKNSKEK